MRKDWYSENKEQAKASNKAYYKRNRKKIRDRDSLHARTPIGLFTRSKIGAKAREIDFTLSFEEYTSLRSLPCYYCEGPLPEAGCGLDRINSDAGYVQGNVRPCCGKCNQAKNDLTDNEFKQHILAIYNHWISDKVG